MDLSTRCLIACLTVVVMAGCGIGSHPVTTRPKAEAQSADWAAVFGAPVELKVTAYVTGFAQTDARVLIDASHPSIPESAKARQWVPAVAYHVAHPDGDLVLDAGITSADARCDYGFRPFFWVPCRGNPRDSVAAQLGRDGVDLATIKYVVVSHFHGDHAGGMKDLAKAGATIVATSDEWAALKKWDRLRVGYLRRQVHGSYPVELVDFDSAAAMSVTDRAVDFYGDGSVWLIPTPGHTPGHLAAVLNVAPTPILLTFDTSHLAVGFENGVKPGFTADGEAAQASLQRLVELKKAHPQLRVLYGHEPSQWPAETGPVQLAP